MHGEVHKYPIVQEEIKYKGKTHRVKAAVTSCFVDASIPATNWSMFNNLVGECLGMLS